MATLPLSDDDRAQLSARADEFHAALVREGAANWDRFLGGLAHHVRFAVLTELVIIDLGYRWGRGEHPTVEEYIQKFPEFGPAERVPSAVILEEHRCRIKAGEKPQPELFRSRFPSQYALICGEIESGHGATIGGTVVATIASADGGAAVAQSVSPGGTAAEYEFLRVLGRGVFGEVWLAQKKGSGIEKAVKVLLQAADHETANRERRALELIKNLRHPYLLATDDFWITDNRLHVAMELADGTLRDQLRRHREAGERGIPVAQLLGYMWEAAEGLDFLHSRHVVHRDIKPDNILLLHGHAKVGDFGLARYQEEVLARCEPSRAPRPIWLPKCGAGKAARPAISTALPLRMRNFARGCRRCDHARFNRCSWPTARVCSSSRT
jgi:serine/threonine protein kinase